MELIRLGWTDFHRENFRRLEESLRDVRARRPGRVSAVFTGYCRAITERGETSATLPVRLRTQAPGTDALPAVGDWAVLEETGPGGEEAVVSILPRRSRISRNSAGRETREQVLASNVDTAFIVGSLNSELSFSRMERFLVAVYEGGASPVVLLNKSDICRDADAKAAELEARMPGVPAHAVSAREGRGMDLIAGHLEAGKTAVFLGSSGVGKSTLINRLLGGDVIRTEEVSDYKDRGRHTTTSRELYLLGGGGIVIDTPGLRELQLWGGEAGLGQTFADIEELAERCRFSDCRHQGEPGCAVKSALDDGTISPERFSSYQKILREALFHKRRQDARLRLEEARRWKAIAKSARHFDKSRRFRND